MKGIKTFPLILEDSFHAEIKRIARRTDKSINKFIMEAIAEKIERDKNIEVR